MNWSLPTGSARHSLSGARGRRRERARVTLDIRTDTGRAYLYDDATSLLLPWSDAREAVLDAYLDGTLAERLPALSLRFGAEDLNNAVRFVVHWAEQRGAFTRTRKRPSAPPDAEECVRLVRRNCMQLVLVITEECNLRCRYCAYSGGYEYERTHSPRRMTPELAEKAIEWFVHLIEPQQLRNPRRQFGLTFYGGEPLLNQETLRAALHYANAKHPGLFLPTMTTNGTLLSRESAEFLLQQGVHVSVSLDGPAAEHDRERVDRAGKGTHARVMRNLEDIRRALPQFRTQGSFITVYSYKSDVAAVSEFFEESDRHMPGVFFANSVQSQHTGYWNAATPAEIALFRQRMAALRESYKQAKVEGRPSNSFDNALIGAEIGLTVLRNRMNDERSPFLPYTAACLPGQKLAVGTQGQLNLCERVNGTYPIGNIDTGVDGERIRRLIEMYQSSALSSCWACPVTKLCSICFAYVFENAAVGSPGQQCERIKSGCQRAFRDFLSIKESNPNATLSLFEEGFRNIDSDVLNSCGRGSVPPPE